MSHEATPNMSYTVLLSREYIIYGSFTLTHDHLDRRSKICGHKNRLRTFDSKKKHWQHLYWFWIVFMFVSLQKHTGLQLNINKIQTKFASVHRVRVLLHEDKLLSPSVSISPILIFNGYIPHDSCSTFSVLSMTWLVFFVLFLSGIHTLKLFSSITLSTFSLRVFVLHQLSSFYSVYI